MEGRRSAIERLAAENADLCLRDSRVISVKVRVKAAGVGRGMRGVVSSGAAMVEPPFAPRR